ncbi:MAG: hypothetical protein ACXU8U_08895 [Asticcacaulis sp.]
MDPFTILSLGSAAAGLLGNVIGGGQKAAGVKAQQDAQNQLTQQQLNSILDQNNKAHEINQWYTGQSQGLADKTQANDVNTIGGADGGAFTTAQQAAQASRAASGNALIDGLTPARNYSDGAPDASGAVKSENARKLVDALNFAKAKSAAGATVNSYGDALLNGGLAIQRGNEGQAVINSDQKRTDAIANMRSNLNTETHQPILSPQAQADQIMPVGSGQFQNGQLLSTGGNILGALAANGVGKGAFDGLFQGAVPTAAGVMGPQQPGIFGGLFR